ncbi:MAG: tripartite tricarboxylate transporter substrate-binding protein [Hyphomicrobiales bacterium]|nr:tripartite tricarboxylate transporter substrate-binding protein [Alphaproteobacteria bacterium]
MKGFKAFATGLAVALLASSAVRAETEYPSRTIKLVVGFGAGGGVDIVARLVAQKLQESLGQNVVVENKPGGNSMLGPDMVAKSAPDGYTLLYGASGQMVISPAVYTNKMPYQTLKDFVPVSLMANYPVILITSAKHPAANMKEFIAWAKANPDKTNYASSSAAFTLSAELFKMKTGTPGQAIIYKSSNESVTNVIGEQVTYAIAEPPPIVPQVVAGKARALAVASPTRLADLPDVPTMKEVGIDMDVSLATGVYAPAGTPPEIVKKLEAECIRIARSPDFQQKLRALSTDTIGSTSAEFIKTLDAEIKMWTEVARKADIKFDR